MQVKKNMGRNNVIVIYLFYAMVGCLSKRKVEIEIEIFGSDECVFLSPLFSTFSLYLLTKFWSLVRQTGKS